MLGWLLSGAFKAPVCARLLFLFQGALQFCRLDDLYCSFCDKFEALLLVHPFLQFLLGLVRTKKALLPASFGAGLCLQPCKRGCLSPASLTPKPHSEDLCLPSARLSRGRRMTTRSNSQGRIVLLLIVPASLPLYRERKSIRVHRAFLESR